MKLAADQTFYYSVCQDLGLAEHFMDPSQVYQSQAVRPVLCLLINPTDRLVVQVPHQDQIKILDITLRSTTKAEGGIPHLLW